MEDNSDSFIVRIWREAVDATGSVAAWKGFITHVGTDQHRHFHDLDVIAQFIQDECQLSSRHTNHLDPGT